MLLLPAKLSHPKFTLIRSSRNAGQHNPCSSPCRNQSYLVTAPLTQFTTSIQEVVGCKRLFYGKAMSFCILPIISTDIGLINMTLRRRYMVSPHCNLSSREANINVIQTCVHLVSKHDWIIRDEPFPACTSHITHHMHSGIAERSRISGLPRKE